MKKHNFLSKTISCLIAVSISAALFAGCQSKSTTSGTAQTTNKAAQSSNTKPNSDEMKNQMQESIKSLVTAGTITQSQADKITETLTSNAPSKDNEQTGTQSNSQPPQGNGQKSSPLSKLVTAGTITQTQADAVMQKMKGNRPANINGQNPPDSNQSTTSK